MRWVLAVPHHVVPCRAMPCHVVPCRTMSCHAVPCHAVPGWAVPHRVVPCRAVSGHAMRCRAAPHCAVPLPCGVCGHPLFASACVALELIHRPDIWSWAAVGYQRTRCGLDPMSKSFWPIWVGSPADVDRSWADVGSDGGRAGGRCGLARGESCRCGWDAKLTCCRCCVIWS